MHRTPKWARHASPLPCNILCFLCLLCVFCVFPCSIFKTHVFCRGARRCALTAAARQNGRGTPRPYPATLCVFCAFSVSSVVFPRSIFKTHVFCRGARRCALTAAARQNGRGMPRPYPVTFCVFCSVSVSSVVSPVPFSKRAFFVGAHSKTGEARLAPTLQPSVFSVAFLCLLWFPPFHFQNARFL